MITRDTMALLPIGNSVQDQVETVVNQAIEDEAGELPGPGGDHGGA
jgi:hypothetical protein